ncbi:MAG: dipeptide epimerase [Sphingobacteriaceae bacterium]|nr:dipeptide epimerase [Sphingobacteriaceae bacterium]
MRLHFVSFLLEFKHAFGVSGNKRTHTPTVFVSLQMGEFIGYGEACMPVYLGETVENTLAFYQSIHSDINSIKSLVELDIYLKTKLKAVSGLQAAKAALSIAFYDLKGKTEGKSLRQLLNIEAKTCIVTSATIGLDDYKKLEIKLNEARDFKILKVKIGGENDKELITFIRSLTDKPLYVDANQGWNNLDNAIEMTHWLKERNVLLVEQPLPKNNLEQMAILKEKSALPIIADESIRNLEDCKNQYFAFHGINIKLMKCGGIQEAIDLINFAKTKNLKIMLGCMAESSCATAAMAQLASFADYIDLDAPHLINNDPFNGITYINGELILENKIGIGVWPKKNSDLFINRS